MKAYLENLTKGTIQMVRNAVGGWMGVRYPGKNRSEYVHFYDKHYEEVGAWVVVKFNVKKHYVTLEWPLTQYYLCVFSHMANAQERDFSMSAASFLT